MGHSTEQSEDQIRRRLHTLGTHVAPSPAWGYRVSEADRVDGDAALLRGAAPHFVFTECRHARVLQIWRQRMRDPRQVLRRQGLRAQPVIAADCV